MNKSLDTITFPDGNTLTVGMEASVSYCADTYPAKIEAIRRVRGGYEVDFRHYGHKWDQTKPGGMGHQNWIICWDQPGCCDTMKLHLDGKPTKGNGYSVSIGHARFYHCWEF